MKEVQVSAELNAPRETVQEYLSPEAIMEYEQTYETEDVEKHDEDTWIVNASADDETGMVVKFKKHADGYIYEQLEGGFFEDFSTTVSVLTIEDASEVKKERQAGQPSPRVRVEFRSAFTFGGRLSPLIDRLARRERRRELKQVAFSLVENLEQSGVINDGTSTIDR